MISRRKIIANILAAPIVARYNFAIAAGKKLPVDTQISRIAFGSCAQQWLEQPIWNAIGNQNPDIFLFLGDAIYGDWDGEKVFTPTITTLKRDWDRLANIPQFANFRAAVPIMAIWDNHDYGKHDGGAEFELKEASKKLFLDFFSESSDSDRRKRSGIYEAKIFGPSGRRVQVIMLDTRTFKDPYIRDNRTRQEKSALNIRGQYLPNENAGATLLGDEQWKWLANQLRKSADIRIIASSTQIVANEKAMEEWGNFPLERIRLFETIEETGANGTILISGNVHFTEISSTDVGPYNLYDFTSSGMTHTTPAYTKLSNKRRIAGPSSELNFGMIQIDWHDKSGTQITLKAFGDSGDVIYEMQVNLDELSQ